MFVCIPSRFDDYCASIQILEKGGCQISLPSPWYYRKFLLKRWNFEPRFYKALQRESNSFLCIFLGLEFCGSLI